MAAMVQALPSPTTASIMSGRPSSASSFSPAQGLTHGYRQSSTGRYKAPASSTYRGMPPYAFTTTPQLSTPSTTTTTARPLSGSLTRHRSSQDSSMLTPTLSLDFSSVPSLDLTLPTLATSTSTTTATAKPSPDRYRRNARRVDSSDSASSRLSAVSAIPSGSGMATVSHVYNHPFQTSSSSTLSQPQTYRGSTYAAPPQVRKLSADDTAVGRSPGPELAARYRRRSLGSIETVGLNHTHDGPDAASPHPNTVIQQQQQPSSRPVSIQRPSPTHGHKDSVDSVASSHSGRSSRRGSVVNDKGLASPAPAHLHLSPVVKQDSRHLATTRPSEPGKRIPSPLSRPVNINGGEPVDETPRRIGGHPRAVSSAAVEQLSSVNEKIGKPKSKLRRAFSFSSTTELRKATVQANLEKSAAANTSHAAGRNSKYEEELESEQAKIAEKQEAAGLGESIYSGQGNFFTGSTDNLSISSTASSASLMLRKMGHGVKKGTRSLVGLFRPKSIIGPSTDGSAAPAPVAEVSMVTVEAEREAAHGPVNGSITGVANGASSSISGSVHEHHLDTLDQSAAAANFLKLDRDSIDTAKFSVDSATLSSDSRSRRSIVGGERERAEVLAAVKKGILKRSDSNQPSPRLPDRQPDFSLPAIPTLTDSPRSSAPSTPADEPGERRRTDSVAIEDSESEGYFASVAHFAAMDSMSVGALTPQTMMRNISFSPRIQFHDTWPSAEYDRRGDIATCNRLTPMLAQQIKEELNTFKMEMEVHESSKVYTHFF
ncbi:hypothetical protein DV738_g1526, partial [Chaetothyriales sp. CBS 135597]